MAGHLLDTNICAHYLNGDARVAAHLEAVDISGCYLSEIVKAEMLYGIAKSASQRRAANRQKFERFFEQFAGRVLLIGAALEIYGQQKAYLRSIGRPTGDLDLLIGCTALAHDLTLVMRNTKHFADLPGLRLENWVDQ